MVGISVIVPSFKRINQTVETVALLLDSKGLNTEFSAEVIVSDATPDSTLKDALFERFSNRIVYTKPNRPGIAANKNHGATIARHEILIFCDSDIEVENDTLLNTLHALQKHTTAAALTGSVFWKGGDENGVLDRPRVEDRKLKIEDTIYVEAIYSRYIATYKSLFWEVGGYDEEVFNMRGEGSDLSIRYWRSGFPLVFDETITVWHKSDAPDSAALRVAHPEWGIAKDYVLLAYKYNMVEGTYPNFEATIRSNFVKLGDKGYSEIIKGIVNNLNFIEESMLILDQQKRNLVSTYPFTFLDIFTHEELVKRCIQDAEVRLEAYRKKI